MVKATLTFDHTTYENHLMIFLGLFDGDKTAKYSYLGIDHDGVVDHEMAMKHNATTDYIPLAKAHHHYFSSTSHTVELKYKTQSPATAYVKNVRILSIRLDTLNPFSDSGHTTYENNFNSSSLDTVYIQGTYFEASYNYHVAYYDDNGAKVLSDGGAISDANGVLNSQWYFPDNTGASPGTWHAVVYDDDVASPPSTYTANDPNSIRETTFTVTQEAIPEFPTVMAAIVVAGLCFGIYYWMRKRRLAYAKA